MIDLLRDILTEEGKEKDTILLTNEHELAVKYAIEVLSGPEGNYDFGELKLTVILNPEEHVKALDMSKDLNLPIDQVLKRSVRFFIQSII